MSKAHAFLKEMLNHHAVHAPELLDLDGKEPEEAIEEASESFLQVRKELFATQVKMCNKIVKSSRAETKKFLAKELGMCDAAYKGLRLYHQLSIELEQIVEHQIKKFYAENNELSEPHLFEVTNYIHLRVCQLFYQIIILLESGLVDGAYTLWYNMHELFSCLVFINTSENPEELAKAYIKYAHKDDGRHLWAKDDKRVTLAKSGTVPFYDIESTCYTDEQNANEDLPYKHLQAKGEKFMLHSLDTPMVQVGLGGFDLSFPALCALRTLHSASEKLAFVLPIPEALILLSTLELWEVKLEKMLTEAEDAYDAYKAAEYESEEED